MEYGYGGKILRVDLSKGKITVDEPEDDFYHRYFGGSGFIGYFLVREVDPGVDPLGPKNKLVFAGGPLTGVPIAGSGRNSVGAKSPLTGGFGQAEVGGFWGGELGHTGYDAVIIEGKAETPVYLWIEDEKAEIKDARHLWGKTTLEVQKLIQKELGSTAIRIAQIGPAGENQVRYACILNDINHAAGRSGIGAVMGSKNLRAIAVRGHGKVPLADEKAVNAMAKALRDDCKENRGAVAMSQNGTAGGLGGFSMVGVLPTRNFQQGSFEGAEKLTGATINETILVKRGGCYACPIRCKPHVGVKGVYKVDPNYGGPEYETLGALGSSCGIDNLEAVALGNQQCSAYGMDTISVGVTIAFAMECFEKGILTEKDTGGLKLNFGNAEVMLELIELIARREAFGKVLAEGSARAARAIGKGAEEFANHVKGQEVPMHDPRNRHGLGLGYAISPTGADHCHNMYDTGYERRIGRNPSAMGILETIPAQELSPRKVRLQLYHSLWQHTLNCLVFCQFVPMTSDKMVELVSGITGWNTSLWEMMKVGERVINMGRALNVREGTTRADDFLPKRFFTPFNSGPLEGVAIKEAELAQAVETYYGMAGWDSEGRPTPAKLEELDIGWVAEAMK
ncbi:MAG: aldehyde ferredoxin oxidoreductase family protein [Dehalococcoidales bacterium]|nr:MAG: aldehyde ferredoxin oxidoreductase family protein [Dehalococcoidales bacterium]